MHSNSVASICKKKENIYIFQKMYACYYCYLFVFLLSPSMYLLQIHTCDQTTWSDRQKKPLWVKPRDLQRPVLPGKSSGNITQMFQLHMVTLVACRQEQGGTRGKENEVEKKSRKGELRTPLQASEQVWTVQLLLVFSSAASGIRNSVLQTPAGMPRQELTYWAIQWMIVELYIVLFSF